MFLESKWGAREEVQEIMLRRGDEGGAKSRGGKNGKAEWIWKKFGEISSTIFFLSRATGAPEQRRARDRVPERGKGPRAASG